MPSTSNRSQGFQARVEHIVESQGFRNLILAAIIVAAILVGISTFPELRARHETLFEVLDIGIIVVFTVEILLKLVALWPKPGRFFLDAWNIFDFFIVVMCLIPFGGASIAVLRLVRLLRVLRLITAIPRLQVLVSAMVKSLPSMSYVMLLLFLLFYIYAVLGVMLFGKNDPE